MLPDGVRVWSDVSFTGLGERASLRTYGVPGAALTGFSRSSPMEPSHGALLKTLALQVALFIALEASASSTYNAIKTHHLLALVFIHIFHLQGRRGGSRMGRIQSMRRYPGYADVDLVASSNNIDFKKKMRMTKQTFMYICQQLAPRLQKQDTARRRAIPLESRVAISLQQLASGTSLYILADSYMVGASTVYGIVLDFCHALKDVCRDMYIRWPSPSEMKQISDRFLDLKGIPMVVGAVDGSHIPIIAPTSHAPDYYSRKGFYSILLQGVVDSSCCFWDYDVGWCGSIHDWNLFSKSRLGRVCHSGGLNPYALLGDAAYQCRPWLFTPYIGSRDGFTNAQVHWNFIQSSSRMYVERAFGMLKLRWRILLKHMECKLEHVPIHVTACLILHNLTIIHRDEFNSSWIAEAEAELLERKNLLLQKRQRRRQASTVEATIVNMLWETNTLGLSETEFYDRSGIDSGISNPYEGDIELQRLKCV